MPILQAIKQKKVSILLLMEMVLESLLLTNNTPRFLGFNPSSNGNGAGIVFLDYYRLKSMLFQSFF